MNKFNKIIMKNKFSKNKKKVLIIILIIFILFTSLNIYLYKDVSFDYWIWLGCPYPMIVWDNYPGHDLTAVYRHENYYKKIPYPGSKYEKNVIKFGEPLQIKEIEKNDGKSFIKATYNGFYLKYYKSGNNDINESEVGSIVITDNNLSFTRDKIKVGDKRDKILHSYRYYKKIQESELEEGYDHGYVDGSMLTGQTFIEFAYDENDRVKYILIYEPF